MKTGKNLTDLLDLNRAQIMRYLVLHPGCSRAELGAATGLTLASITKITRTLIEAGVIYETGFAEGKKGRRSVGLSLNYDNYKVIAARLSWQRLELSVFDFMGNSYGEQISIPVDSLNIENIEKAADLLAENIQRLKEEFPEIGAAGIATIGPYHRSTGSVLLPPYSKDPEKRHYYQILERLTGQLSLPVFMDHDASLGALGYWRFHTDCTKPQVIMNILAGDGIGIGIVDSGKIYAGTSNCSSELGHITLNYQGRPCTCGSTGCLNAYASARAMMELVKEQLGDYPDSKLNQYPSLGLYQLLQCAKQNDPLAMKIISDEGEYLGHGIVSLLNIFDPDLIVISGSVAAAGEPLLTSIQETFQARQSGFTRTPELTLFSSTTDLMLKGAAAFAMENMLNRPTKYMCSDIGE